MGTVTAPGIDTDVDVDLSGLPASSGPWQAVVWNDPVNLMSYVVYVFRSYFGCSPDEATRLMLAVHHDGHAIVAEGAREQMELHVQAMHDYGLWATVRESSP
ncbi:ATP-dependent Clp protease adapter ClpS [Microbacterium sp. P01]|uniref:ATP-dependent Clp protease adapter ClpS n=1 Tax=unclassified Microbacterium TaxID=2609290 RepID=UPI00366C5403